MRSSNRMKRFLPKLGVALLLLFFAGLAAVSWLVHAGISTRAEPSAAEVRVARTLRHLAIPSASRRMKNALPISANVLSEGREHFADHCASCHGNDGRGTTDLGRSFYPRVPDMTLPATQNLSDGELFYIIENGVRLTGMPAWGNGTEEGARQSWALVHFLRHLPKMTPQEMQEMKRFNPVSPMEAAEQKAEDEFLAGGEEQPQHQH